MDEADPREYGSVHQTAGATFRVPVGRVAGEHDAGVRGSGGLLDEVAWTMDSFIRRSPLRSSVIAAVGYDPDTAELEVEFRSGDVYRYYAVPASVHRALVEADSPGAYFNRRISDHYPTRQQY